MRRSPSVLTRVLIFFQIFSMAFPLSFIGRTGWANEVPIEAAVEAINAPPCVYSLSAALTGVDFTARINTEAAIAEGVEVLESVAAPLVAHSIQPASAEAPAPTAAGNLQIIHDTFFPGGRRGKFNAATLLNKLTPLPGSARDVLSQIIISDELTNMIRALDRSYRDRVEKLQDAIEKKKQEMQAKGNKFIPGMAELQRWRIQKAMGQSSMVNDVALAFATGTEASALSVTSMIEASERGIQLRDLHMELLIELTKVVRTAAPGTYSAEHPLIHAGREILAHLAAGDSEPLSVDTRHTIQNLLSQHNSPAEHLRGLWETITTTSEELVNLKIKFESSVDAGMAAVAQIKETIGHSQGDPLGQDNYIHEALLLTVNQVRTEIPLLREVIRPFLKKYKHFYDFRTSNLVRLGLTDADIDRAITHLEDEQVLGVLLDPKLNRNILTHYKDEWRYYRLIAYDHLVSDFLGVEVTAAAADTLVDVAKTVQSMAGGDKSPVPGGLSNNILKMAIDAAGSARAVTPDLEPRRPTPQPVADTVRTSIVVATAGLMQRALVELAKYDPGKFRPGDRNKYAAPVPLPLPDGVTLPTELTGDSIFPEGQDPGPIGPVILPPPIGGGTNPTPPGPQQPGGPTQPFPPFPQGPTTPPTFPPNPTTPIAQQLQEALAQLQQTRLELQQTQQALQIAQSGAANGTAANTPGARRTATQFILAEPKDLASMTLGNFFGQVNHALQGVALMEPGQHGNLQILNYHLAVVDRLAIQVRELEVERTQLDVQKKDIARKIRSNTTDAAADRKLKRQLDAVLADLDVLDRRVRLLNELSKNILMQLAGEWKDARAQMLLANSIYQKVLAMPKTQQQIALDKVVVKIAEAVSNGVIAQNKDLPILAAGTMQGQQGGQQSASIAAQLLQQQPQLQTIPGMPQAVANGQLLVPADPGTILLHLDQWSAIIPPDEHLPDTSENMAVTMADQIARYPGVRQFIFRPSNGDNMLLKGIRSQMAADVSYNSSGNRRSWLKDKVNDFAQSSWLNKIKKRGNTIAIAILSTALIGSLTIPHIPAFNRHPAPTKVVTPAPAVKTAENAVPDLPFKGTEMVGIKAGTDATATGYYYQFINTKTGAITKVYYDVVVDPAVPAQPGQPITLISPKGVQFKGIPSQDGTRLKVTEITTTDPATTPTPGSETPTPAPSGGETPPATPPPTTPAPPQTTPAPTTPAPTQGGKPTTPKTGGEKPGTKPGTPPPKKP